MEDTDIVEPQAVDPSPETQAPSTAQQPSPATTQDNDIDQVLSTLAEHPEVSNITNSVRQASATALGLIDTPTVTEPSVAAAQVEVVPSGVDESGVSQQGGTDTTATGDSVAAQQYTEQQQYTEPSGASVVTDDQSATGQTAQQDTPVAVEVTPTTTNATGASETAPTVVTQQETASPQATTATQDTTAAAPTVADTGTATAAGEMAGNTNSAAPSEG